MGRVLRLIYTKYGVLEGVLVVPGIAPLQDPPSCTTPGTPLPAPPATRGQRDAARGPTARLNQAVGLISVAQLTSRPLFSGLRTITELYNLSELGNR